MAITHLGRVTGRCLFRYGCVGADRNSCSARYQKMLANLVTSHAVM